MSRSGIVLILVVVALSGCADKTRERVVAPAPAPAPPVVVAVPEPSKKVKAVEQGSPEQSTEQMETVVELRRETDRAGRKKAPAEARAVPPEPPREIRRGKQKKVFEFIEIDGEKYTVPWPWRGKRIEEPAPSRSALMQIPQAFTWNESRLFIRRDACEAFLAMARRAAEDGIELRVHSGFRSIRYQKNIFSRLMAEGRTWDDLVRYVAPPGYSEHMLGVAVDLYPSNWQFASTDAYRWLQDNASDFGFSETYPEDGSEGFPWEAWHWRYTGPENADSGEFAAQTVKEHRGKRSSPGPE